PLGPLPFRHRFAPPSPRTAAMLVTARRAASPLPPGPAGRTARPDRRPARTTPPAVPGVRAPLRRCRLSRRAGAAGRREPGNGPAVRGPGVRRRARPPGRGGPGGPGGGVGSRGREHAGGVPPRVPRRGRSARARVTSLPARRVVPARTPPLSGPDGEGPRQILRQLTGRGADDPARPGGEGPQRIARRGACSSERAPEQAASRPRAERLGDVEAPDPRPRR